MLRTIAIVVLHLCLVPHFTRAASEIKITGIWRLSDQTFALCEEYFRNKRAPHRTFQLAPGERAGFSSGTNRFSITTIDSERGLIRADIAGTNQTIQLKSALNAEHPGLAVDSASVDHLIAIYARLRKINVLPHPEIHTETVTFTTNFLDDTAAAQFLRQKLSQKAISLVPFSKHFELAVPDRFAKQKIDRTKSLKPKTAAEIFKAGDIELFSAAISQVIEICADILGGEYDRSVPLPNIRHQSLTFTLTTPASREEVVDALQQSFLWEGFKLVPTDADKFIPVAAQ